MGLSQVQRGLDDRPIPAGDMLPRMSRTNFIASYPTGPHKLQHRLASHPLLQPDAVKELARSLPLASIATLGGEENRSGDKPSANDACVRPALDCETAMTLKNIEQVPHYAALLDNLLGQMEGDIHRKSGRIRELAGFILSLEPGRKSCLQSHCEHLILLQLSGTSTITVFPPNDQQPANVQHGSSHLAPHRQESAWPEAIRQEGMTFSMCPDEAVYVPVLAPYLVRNGEERAITLAITWQSAWSSEQADVRALNAVLRGWGLCPAPPRPWPAQNRFKATCWRLARHFCK